MPRSPGYAAARQRLIAYRWVPLDHPRIHIRVDPIVHRSLVALAVGVALILAGFLLEPLILLDRLTPTRRV